MNVFEVKVEDFFIKDKLGTTQFTPKYIKSQNLLNTKVNVIIYPGVYIIHFDHFFSPPPTFSKSFFSPTTVDARQRRGGGQMAPPRENF